MDGHNFQKLKAHILSLSVASSFDEARTEWTLRAVEVSDEMDECPCGKDIKEHCFIKNTENGNETHVGNVCINRFIGIDTGNIFDGLKRIASDITANPNKDLIEHAYSSGYLFDEKEYKFLKSTRLKRKLSSKQMDWKIKINRRILSKTKVHKRSK